MSYHGKVIYNPSGKAGEYSYWACNFYVGCSNGCEYCYCKKGIFAPVMGQDKPQLKKCFKNETDAFEIFSKELDKNLGELQKHGLFFSFTTDPLLPETEMLTFWAAGTVN
jgi:DNA repair photolyase